MTITEYYKYYRDIIEDLEANVSFMISDIEEALSGFRSSIPRGDFVLVAITYFFRTHTLEQSAYRKELQGGFMLIAPCRHDDYAAMEAAQANTEKVFLEIKKRMVNDSAQGLGTWGDAFRFDDFEIAQPVSYEGDGTFVGWRTTFNLDTHFKECLDTAYWKHI